MEPEFRSQATIEPSGIWKAALYGATFCTALALMPLIIPTETPPPSPEPMTATSAPQGLATLPAKHAADTGQSTAPQIASKAGAASPLPQPQPQPEVAATPSVSSHAPGSAPPVADAPDQEPSTSSAAMGLSSEIAEADQHCLDGKQSQAPLIPPPPRPAIILGFLTPSQSERAIEVTQARTNVMIDPAYRDNLRASVHPVNAPAGAKTVVIIPKGMGVHMGDEVAIVGWHASPTLACRYIPNAVVLR